MTSLISVSVPEEFRERVTLFCRERQQIPGELTITVIEPSLLEKVTGLESKLQSFCLAQSDFNLVIGGPSVFNNQLLYLNVLPGFISMVRGKLMNYLKLQTPDNKVYRPHLTMLRAQPGHKTDMQKLLAEAREQFVTPYAYSVGAFELFVKKNDTTPFKHKATIPFTGR